MSQLTFADIVIADKRKPSRISIKLEKINNIVKWEEILEIVKVVDRTDKRKGGAPNKDLLVKIKMLFLQSQTPSLSFDSAQDDKKRLYKSLCGLCGKIF